MRREAFFLDRVHARAVLDERPGEGQVLPGDRRVQRHDLLRVLRG
jgi:hypothetical protein